MCIVRSHLFRDTISSFRRGPLVGIAGGIGRIGGKGVYGRAEWHVLCSSAYQRVYLGQ